PRLDPVGVESLREEPRVRRRSEVGHDVAVHERVEVWPDHHDAPWGRDGARDGRRLRQTGGLRLPVAQRERVAGRRSVPEAGAEGTLSVSLDRKSVVEGKRVDAGGW